MSEQNPPAGEAAPTPTPAPRPGPVPSPAALARPRPRPAAAPVVAHAPSDSARFGRVAEDGTVFVSEGESERAVGSYPGASAEDALQYFARKYDELYASADLLQRRASSPEVTAKELQDGLKKLKEQTVEPNIVGDLGRLREVVERIETAVAQKRKTESAARAQARAEATTAREALVAEAETIAAQPEQSIQWKQSSGRMRELLEEWKNHQRSGARLDKDVEAKLWERFARARNGFDKMRKAHFAQLEETRGAAKAEKEALVAEAEKLSTSTDWGTTAGAFKRLMDQWRRAGRASRSDDDALWERFRAAQDAFFEAKDRVAAEEDESYRPNLEVKEALLAEAQKILPVSDVERAKAQLRTIQDRWEKAGKVPRADVERTEGALRKIESAVREAEDARWSKSNPEAAARASSMVTQLEASLAKTREDLEEARAKGRAKKVADLEEKIRTQEAWLAQARTSLSDFA